jgi:uncharacterized protein
MLFTIACPGCDSKLKATEALLGKTVKCPRCGKPVVVEEPKPAAAATMPRLELPSSSMQLEEPEMRNDFVEEDEGPTPTRALVERNAIVEVLPEVDDEAEVVEEAELDEAVAAYDDGASRKKKRRGRGGPTQDEKTMAMFIYLLGIFTHFIGPIILWMMKKDESKFIDYHGKQMINFSITMALASLILGVVGFPLIIVTFGLGALIVVPLGMALGIYALVMTIIGATKANNGEWYEFPISLRLIK